MFIIFQDTCARLYLFSVAFIKATTANGPPKLHDMSVPPIKLVAVLPDPNDVVSSSRASRVGKAPDDLTPIYENYHDREIYSIVETKSKL